MVAEDLLDLTLLLEISKSLAGQATVDLQTVDKGGDSDETVGLDILVEPLGGRLLKDDGVLGLVLNYSSKNETSAFRSLSFFGPASPSRSSSYPIQIPSKILSFAFSFFVILLDDGS